MFILQKQIDRKVTVACSGGADSMAVLDFLSNNHEVTALFIHHGTATSSKAMKFLENYVDAAEMLGKNKIKLRIEGFFPIRPVGVSKEEWWRNERYKIFHDTVEQVITAHHLDDCMETWIWSSLNGEGKIIPYANKNVIRPFRANRKYQFENWCVCHNVPWIEDETNKDTKHIRNYIRHELMPHALHVNPGLAKVIRKKVMNE